MTMVTENSTPEPEILQPAQEAKTLKEQARLTLLHDSFTPVWITPTVQVGPILPGDEAALIQYLNMPCIHSQLLSTPKPYLLSDAQSWIQTRYERLSKKDSLPLNYIIRDMKNGGKVIGSLDVSEADDDDPESDDTGYWLAPEKHGQGIMAKALKMMLYRVSVLCVGKRKFTAYSFEGNWPSRRVLEKVGFVYQPEVKLVVTKDGRERNTWAYHLFLSEEDVHAWGQLAEATPLAELVQS